MRNRLWLWIGYGVGLTALAQGPAISTDQVRVEQVWPNLQMPLRTYGDRLIKPGKERVLYVGTITRVTEAARPFTLIREPGKARVEEVVAGRTRVTTFDGSRAMYPDDKVAADEDVLETVLNDSEDNFFRAHVTTGATQGLGAGYRLDDGKNDKYRGPFYSVYRMIDRVNVGTEMRQQGKAFFINDATNLLERITYTRGNDAQQRRIVVVLEWRKQGAETVLAGITRQENGHNVFQIRLASAAVQPRVVDAVFTR